MMYAREAAATKTIHARHHRFPQPWLPRLRHNFRVTIDISNVFQVFSPVSLFVFPSTLYLFIYFSRYLVQETVKWPFRSLCQTAYCLTTRR